VRTPPFAAHIKANPNLVPASRRTGSEAIFVYLLKMTNSGNNTEDSATPAETTIGETKMSELGIEIPLPSASYRRRAWAAFQHALDPLAPLKPPPRPPG
jgi:hypothetical protein